MKQPPLPPVTLRQPPHLAFGAGVRAEAVDYLRRVGASSLVLVTTAPIRPLAESFADGLRSAGLTVTVFDEVPAEPGVSHFEHLRGSLDPASFDTVVGLGGGSVLDLAKLLAALAGRPEAVREVFGIGLLGGRARRLVCLPTTAGTGSEVSPNAILLDEADELKKGVVSPWLVPDAAFVDPELTLSLPAPLTAATGIDALVHCIEAYANLHAHPVVDLYALEGMRRIARHLPRAVHGGDDLAARSEVMLGALYGGLCLGPVNTAAVHALAYPLGGEFHLAHGISNALLLPHVLRFNLPAAPARYAAVARAMGVEDAGEDLATAEAGVRFLENLCWECGLPSGLAALGVPVEALPRMARAALTVTRLLRNNPRP
jgi:alcohol dehydrogenase